MKNDSMKRPSVTGLAEIAFHVSSLEASRKFYCGFLGFEEINLLTDRNSSAVCFAVNERQCIILFECNSSQNIDRLHHIGFSVEDIHSMQKYLLSKNILTNDCLIRDIPDSGRISIEDPGGHTVVFISRNEYRVTGSDQRISERITHAGIAVRDADAGHKFYCEMLGFTEIWRGGKQNLSTDWINMKLPESDDYIEYMMVKDKADKPQVNSLYHICLRVDDVLASHEELIRKAGDFRIDEPKIGVNNKRQLNIFDPDGIRIELMESFETVF